MKVKLQKALRWFFASYIWLGLLILVVDIVTKNVVVQNQNAIYSAGGQHGGVDVIPGFLGINYVINRNIVFGWDVFKNPTANRIVFILMALIISGILIFVLIKKWGKLNKYYKACIFLIIAGALGNAIDRIFYSAEYLNKYDPVTQTYITGVVDWIDCYNLFGWEFPNFNIADSAIVIAAFMLIIYMIVVDIKDYRKKSKLEPKKEKDNTKVLSKTEQEKNAYLEENKTKDE